MKRGAADVRLVRRVSASEGGRPLIDLLAGWAASTLGEGVPRSRLRAMVAAGAVRVDGVPSRAPGRPLPAGIKVDLRLRPRALRPKTERTDRPFVLTPASVLYRDEWLIAVDKPPGLPTHATADPRRPSLVAAVERLLADETGRPYVAVHQRLDRDTSGVVLFAIERSANAGLARAFAGRELVKGYLALSSRTASESPVRFTVEEPLSIGADGRVRVGGTDAKPALTEVLVREQAGRLALVEALPRSGRKHQVRVHLAHVGLPILGDPLYGPRPQPRGSGRTEGWPRPPRLMLHAARLALAHPISGRPLVLESPLPPDFVSLLRQARSAAR
jgi:23S rRNA pseudouridine1911/1915/1917 synthase